jgi:hypothetical protein
MKKFLLSFMLSFGAMSSFGQVCVDEMFYTFNFENSLEITCLQIDTVSDPNNLWQIGAPQKTLFTSAYSTPNAVVTDLLNPYPINDTSAFIIKMTANGGGFDMPYNVGISGRYFVDSDTLSDFGKIEFSPDNGASWINLFDSILIDTLNNEYWYWEGTYRPTLSGNSGGWQIFGVDIAWLGHNLGVTYTDTVWYRFTFISDSVHTGKDGLMYDDLEFENYAWGVDEFQSNNLIALHPNPASDQLTIQRLKFGSKSSIQIIDFSGKVILDNPNFNGEAIDTQALPNGIYLLRYSDSKNVETKKFLINH